MIITKEQAQFIADLAGQIQEQYGFVVGYTNPNLPNLGFPDADFVIYDNPELEDLHCFYKDDIQVKAVGPYKVKVLPAEPEFDEKVEELLAQINEDLLSGKIWFDPGVTREVDGVKVTVTKRSYPNMPDVFETNIYSQGYGMVYAYKFINDNAPFDARFKIAKDIIDEFWPQPEVKTVKTKNPKNNDPQDLLSRILKLFGL